MARFDNLSGYSDILDPLAVFNAWLYADYQETAFGREDQDESNPRTATCYIDYLFVFLVEGPGAWLFPTYEDWLLGIIRFADDLYSPREQYGRGSMLGEPAGVQETLPDARSTTTMGFLDWGAMSRDKKLNEKYVDAIGMNFAGTQRPADEEGMRHPALDRNVFERCRDRARRQQD